MYNKNSIKPILLIAAFIFSAFLFSGGLLYGQENPDIKSSNQSSNQSSSFSQSKFVPDISFILDFSYAYRNLDDETFEGLSIPEFTHSHTEASSYETHEHGMNSHKGFNLNYGELGLYSAVDPYLELFGTFHLSEESFGIEEAFFNTTSFPGGFQVKAGKFLSKFGRVNEQHAHTWDFADQPVVYNTLLGGEGILEKGVQLTWVAPLDFFLLIGGELLEGENENSFGSEGFSNNVIHIDARGYPNLYTGFVESSIDIDDLTFLFGFSYAGGKARINHGISDTSGHAVYGSTMVFGGDLTVKYFIDSYRYFSFQGEYLFRNIDGKKYAAGSSGTTTYNLEKNQSGLYSQVVVKPFLQWRMGARFEMLHLNKVTLGGSEENTKDNLFKCSAMLEYNATEFSRLRLQYNYDKTKYDTTSNNKIIHEIVLECNITIGAHGAHSF
ncbi:MAG: hypothetical protein GY754_10710 [bacterium]|nr:hypothetical protein [bacterium]